MCIFKRNKGKSKGQVVIPDSTISEWNNLIIGSTGSGKVNRLTTPISNDCQVVFLNESVGFIKNGDSLVLTKEELINEFKLCLDKGFFTMEEVLGRL